MTISHRMSPTPSAVPPSPIHRIPQDILLEIFQTDVTPLPAKGISLIASQVCSAWRTIACANPLIWSSFTIVLTRKDKDTNLLQLYLTRSGNCLLTVHIGHKLRNMEQRESRKEIELLAAHCQRLRRLSFPPCYSPNIWKPDLRALHGPFPELESLDYPPPKRCWTKGLFLASPKLLTLRLEEPDSLFHLEEEPHHIPTLGIRTIQLRELHLLGGVNTRRLAAYTHLTHLNCSLGEFRGHKIYTSESLTLPHLVSWTMNFAENEGRPPLFDAFTTPALKTLCIISARRPANIARLIDRSQCHLKHLTLKSCSVRNAEMLEIFQLCVDLQSFTLIDGTPTSIMNPLLEALSVRDGQMNLLPRLTSLLIDGLYPMFDTPKLLDMLQTRTASAPNNIFVCLEFVSITLRDRAVYEPSLPQFRRMQFRRSAFYCLDESKNLCRIL
ncbi:hypothetical protein C8R43DRAFT_1205616 [Mycena crocata]|nr:hypothetical protein C8R43DRAFT_1205616 [Mycena crocata]